MTPQQGASVDAVSPLPSSELLVEDEAGWSDVLEAFHGRGDRLPERWRSIFEPLWRAPAKPLIVGQLGQSLDGRIATASGHSKYINGSACLIHLHRLRAICDAVVIGVGTAICDAPRLTVRHIEGASPARVVIDPHGRLKDWSSLHTADGVRCLMITGEHTVADVPQGVEIHRLKLEGRGIAPSEIAAFLGRQGFRRVLLEGGAVTVSRFVSAGRLDRLHLLISPMIIGSGAPGLQLPPIDRVDQALRPVVTTHKLGDEILVDCDLRRSNASFPAAEGCVRSTG